MTAADPAGEPEESGEAGEARETGPTRRSRRPAARAWSVAVRWLLPAAGAALVLGVVAGAVWAAVVPQVTLQRVSGGLELDETSGAALYAFDGWYAVVAAVGGLVTGVLALPVVRRRGWPTVVAAGLVATVAGLVQWGLGTHLDRGAHTGVTPGTGGRSAVALSLSGHAALALWPLAAALVLAVASLAAPRRFDRLGPPDILAPAGDAAGRPPG